MITVHTLLMIKAYDLHQMQYMPYFETDSIQMYDYNVKNQPVS